MFSFTGQGIFDRSKISNTTISNCVLTSGSIAGAAIDMGDQVITSLHDPQSTQDAATKNYVDALGITHTLVTLDGTNPATIPIYTGAFVVVVKPLNTGGPCAIFHVSKSMLNGSACVFRTSLSPGSDSTCTLRIAWPQSSGILIYKTNSMFDGSYVVKCM